MEEQVLTQKQYKTLKFVWGWLLADFIIMIIAVVSAVFGLVFLFISLPYISAVNMQMPPETWLSFLGLIPEVIGLILIVLLLFNKKPNRKDIISITMLINAALMAVSSVVSLIMGNPASALMNSGYNYYSGLIGNSNSFSFFYGFGMVLSFVATAIFLILAVCLFRKTKGTLAGTLPYKLLFILYIVLLYACEFIIMFAVMPSSMPGFIGIMIFVCIFMGFFTFMGLFPFIALYKALDDEVFYENFIVENPLIAIKRYEARLFRPAVQEPQAMFCSKCGVPLVPGASFCRACGKPVNSQEPEPPAAKPLTGPEE